MYMGDASLFVPSASLNPIFYYGRPRRLSEGKNQGFNPCLFHLLEPCRYNRGHSAGPTWFTYRKLALNKWFDHAAQLAFGMALNREKYQTLGSRTIE